MPITTPDFGIDPALLQQPVPQTTPMDVVGRALDALAASGMQVGPVNPTLFGQGPAEHYSTDLGDPGTEPSAPQAQTLAQLQGGQLAAEQPVVHLPAETPKGQQAYPSTPQEAAIQGQQAGVARRELLDSGAPLNEADVQGYEYREGKALDQAHIARLKQAVAEHQAEQSQAERLAQVELAHAHDLEVANSLYTQQRQAIHAETDAETAAWVQEYQAKAAQEPNPDRWFESRTGLGKALWALGMVFGAIHAGITPGAQNVALQLALREIHQDVDLQKERLNRELDALKQRGTLMEKRQARLLTDAADDHSMFMGRLQALKQAYLQRAMANPSMQAGLAGVEAWFAQEELKAAGSKREAAVQVREGQLNRAHSTYLARLTDTRTRAIAAAEIAKDYDLAQLKAATDKDQARLAMMKDVRGIPMTLGAKMVGSPLGETIQVNKEEHTKMSGVFEVANRRYEALKKVDEAIKDGSFAGRIATGDPELRSAARYLGYTTGKELDPQGRLSDQDVKFATAIDLGYDPAGNAFDQLRFGQNSDRIQKMIENEMRAMPEKVSKHASMYLDTNLVGDKTRVLWSPQAIYQDAPPTQNATQVLQGAGLLRSPEAPIDAADFERRQALEKGLGAGSQLPGFDQGKVNEFAAGLQGMSPDYIRKLADKTLSDLGAAGSNRDPWAGKVDPSALTTRAAMESVRDKAIKEAEGQMKRAKDAADRFGFVEGLRGHPKPTAEELGDMVRNQTGLSTPDAVEAAVKAAEAAYNRGRKITSFGEAKSKD